MKPIITNQEIKKKFPQIKYFINDWASGNVDSTHSHKEEATKIIILCSQGIKGEGEQLITYETKDQALSLYKEHLFNYIGIQLATPWDCVNEIFTPAKNNCLIWREKPLLDDRGFFVYSRLLVTFVDIEV